MEKKWRKKMNSFLDAMVYSGQLTKEVFDMWYERMTTVIDPNICPWDPWLDSDWRKRDRNSFEGLAHYYNDDAWVCQQVRMLPSWDALEVSPLVEYIKPGTRVLDYGCGPGHSGIPCVQAGADVTFADISPRLLIGVTTLCEAHGFKVSSYQAVDPIPEIPGTYDIIICKDVLEHVKYPVELLERLVSVLVPGGVVWMTVFFNGHELSPYHLPEHYHMDHGTKWLDICKKIGLEPIDNTDRFYRKVR
jgi:SAM-dependent methyltransferase